MEKTNRIVITRKEEKALKNLERLFEIMGVNLPQLCDHVEKLESENKELRAENASLKDEIKSVKEENEKLITTKMNQIAINIQKATAEKGTGMPIGKFGFRGKSIDETY